MLNGSTERAANTALSLHASHSRSTLRAHQETEGRLVVRVRMRLWRAGAWERKVSGLHVACHAMFEFMFMFMFMLFMSLCACACGHGSFNNPPMKSGRPEITHVAQMVVWPEDSSMRVRGDHSLYGRRAVGAPVGARWLMSHGGANRSSGIIH